MAKELKPFDKILVRNSNKRYWIPAFYGFKSKDMKHHLTSAGWQDECIPYEGNEEYLGTNKDYVCRNFSEIVESEDKKIWKQIKMFIISHSRNESINKIDSWLAWLEKQGEQKPVEWSEEDLICLGYLADFVDKNGDDFYGKNKPNVVKWIRSFTELPTHIPINEIEQKTAWSEEDEEYLKAAIWYAENPAPNVAKNAMLVEWVKNLKGRVQPQPKHEWSEEDEENKKTLRFLAYENCDAEDASRLITWLENLKEKEQILHLQAVYEKPAELWKPTKEQIKALDYLIRCLGESGTVTAYDSNLRCATALLQDLKKMVNDR